MYSRDSKTGGRNLEIKLKKKVEEDTEKKKVQKLIYTVQQKAAIQTGVQNSHWVEKEKEDKFNRQS